MEKLRYGGVVIRGKCSVGETWYVVVVIQGSGVIRILQCVGVMGSGGGSSKIQCLRAGGRGGGGEGGGGGGGGGGRARQPKREDGLPLPTSHPPPSTSHSQLTPFKTAKAA